MSKRLHKTEDEQKTKETKRKNSKKEKEINTVDFPITIQTSSGKEEITVHFTTKEIETIEKNKQTKKLKKKSQKESKKNKKVKKIKPAKKSKEPTKTKVLPKEKRTSNKQTKETKNKYIKIKIPTFLANFIHKAKSKLKHKDNSIKKKYANKEPYKNKDLDNKVFKIKNLNFYYNNGKKQALYDINLNLKRNKITAFIGPSGCGKSTLLRTLNRMNDLTDGIKITGQILFNDQNIYENNKNIITLRTKVGMVFQKANPFPMSIYDNIAYGPRNQGIRNKKVLNQIVKDSLQEAALWEEVKTHLYDSALSLSGGQQQRLCIARALALKPEVLLMDEPTSALDPIASAKIEELILRLKKEYTIIIVTHSMTQAARVSHQTAFFLDGKLVEFNETKKLFSRPTDKKTEEYITGRLG